ncbi:MAG: hypothetical protein NTV21_19750 [Planctomycetota bacterium]|nr:hypothetical protein [Planctomycetota bacterium]
MALLKATVLMHALALATLGWMRTVGGYERIETLPIAFVYALVALTLGFVGLRSNRAGPASVGMVHGTLVLVALVLLAM